MKNTSIIILIVMLMLPSVSEAARTYVFGAGEKPVNTRLKIVRKNNENKMDFRLTLDSSNPTTFNDGWRWVYRKKVMQLLKDKDDSIKARVLREELGLNSESKEDIIKEGLDLVSALKIKGESSKAEVLSALIYFFSDEKDPAGLESKLRLHRNTGYEQAGEFILGSYYEAKGFYPEASGHYSRLSKGEDKRFVTAAAKFMRARHYFFDSKLKEAKELFKASWEAGFSDSAMWLANTCLIKGEFDYAAELYGKNTKPNDDIDAITLLSMGDLFNLKGEFDKARLAFGNLKARYPKDNLLDAFFSLKIGDTFLREGKIAEAENAYTKVKVRFSGEPWAMASLSIADLYAAAQEPESLKKSIRTYKEIAEGGYIGSEITYFSLITTYIKTGNFEEALARMKSFAALYPTSPMRADLPRIQGTLVYKWMDALYNGGDFYGVIKLNAEYGAVIPFGKKAETYLKAGTAAYSLGLFSEAAGNLDNAIKSGGEKVVQEATITLSKVYLSQNDPEAAERLLSAFTSRYPKNPHNAEAGRMFFETAFMKGDYKKVVDSKVIADDPEFTIKKAIAFSKLGRHKESIPHYEKAAAMFNAQGDTARLSDAYIGEADADFAIGRYSEAIDAYRKALSFDGGKIDRSWPLYRIAQSYSKLNKEDEKEKTLEELKALNTEIGNWSAPIFKDAASL
ncbi:MAG: tetratricopeptide repeat protein [Deltaproteobacteria bacterium]|nr:tetratricopeptide repeat protein [Deltaproteobacteria bacterium]